jgi:hypothetical protein
MSYGRSGRHSTVTDAQIAAALANDGNRRRAAANEAHCSVCLVVACCDRNGVPEAPRPSKSCSSYKPPIRWTEDKLTLLRKLFIDDLRSVDEIASEFNTTVTGIRTALSRAGLNETVQRKETYRIERKCLCCRMPFMREGAGNRQCVMCFEENSRIAA